MEPINSDASLVKKEEWIKSVKKELSEASKLKDWNRCIQICRAALKEESLLVKADWVNLRKNLALFLLEINPKLHADEAINIYKEILKYLESSKDLKILASTHRAISFAYNEKGDVASRLLLLGLSRGQHFQRQQEATLERAP